MVQCMKNNNEWSFRNEMSTLIPKILSIYNNNYFYNNSSYLVDFFKVKCDNV